MAENNSDYQDKMIKAVPILVKVLNSKDPITKNAAALLLSCLDPATNAQTQAPAGVLRIARTSMPASRRSVEVCVGILVSQADAPMAAQLALYLRLHNTASRPEHTGNCNSQGSCKFLVGACFHNRDLIQR